MSPEAELRRQVASLLVVRGSGHAEDRQRRYPRWELPNQELRRLIGEGIGGVILLGGSSTELQQRCQTLQSWAREPLLLCADVEEGVGQRFEGGTWLVPPMALGRLHARDPERAIALAERYGRCTGRQARRCGLNWVLAPVADVNNNPGNPVINVRAWGDSPDCVKALACAFQRGLASTGVLGCAKHFPGHGDTGVDSHLQLPVLRHDQARLERVELPPFAQLIQTGVDSVMTAHLLIPALDPELPATLSRAVLTNLLRDDLGFQGLVVTDALVMEAISKRWGAGEAARLAFAAGADLILMPADADAAIEAIVAALQSGVIPREHLETALARRQQALQKVAAAAASGATGEGFQDEPLELDGERSLALELIQLSLETQGPLPLPPLNAEGINLLRVDTVLPSPLLRADAPSLALAEAAGYRSLICHPQGISPWRPGADENPLALERLGDGNVLLQLFLRGNPFRGERDRAEPWSAALRQLQRQQRLAGLVVYGCPYTWANLRRELEPQIPAVYAPGQMAEAQQAALSLLLGSSEPSAMAVEGFTD